MASRSRESINSWINAKICSHHSAVVFDVTLAVDQSPLFSGTCWYLSIDIDNRYINEDQCAIRICVYYLNTRIFENQRANFHQCRPTYARTLFHLWELWGTRVWPYEKEENRKNTKCGNQREANKPSVSVREWKHGTYIGISFTLMWFHFHPQLHWPITHNYTTLV